MSRKPTFIASRDRGDVDIDLDDMPDTGAYIDLDDDNPNNIQIIEEDDTPEADRGKPTQVDEPLDVTEEELRGLSAKTQQRIKRLTFERETERRRAETAEREGAAALTHAQRIQQENDRLRTSVGTAGASLAASMLKERENAMATARAKLAEAHNNGDGVAIADATAEVSQLASEITIIKSNAPKPRDPNAPADQPAQPQRQQEQAPQLDPNVVDWLGKNRWFNQPGNEEKTAVAMAVHKRLIDSGVKTNSSEYTKGLDEGLKRVFTDHRTSTDRNAPAGEREPARRGDIVGQGSRQPADTQSSPRRVVLTPSELKLASQLGVTPQAYAASKVKYTASTKGSAR